MDVPAAAIRPDTILKSASFVNNEIGVIQDISAIGAWCREKGILLRNGCRPGDGPYRDRHERLPIDLMSMTAHKTAWPLGIGAVYCAAAACAWKRRSTAAAMNAACAFGTLPTHQIVGMGEAFRIAKEEMHRVNASARAFRSSVCRWA